MKATADEQAQKRYAHVCWKLSRRHRVPFEVGLVLGMRDRNYNRFNKSLKEVAQMDEIYRESYITDLNSSDKSIQRRALRSIMGNSLYDDIISDSSNKNIERLTRYILKKLS